MIDFDFIANRFEDMADTLRRMPAHNPHRRSLTYWPDIVENYWTAYGATPIMLRPVPPTMQQIDKLEEAIEWLFYVPGETEPEKHLYRSIILARGFKISYRKIGRMMNYSKDKVKQEWLWAIINIMNRLNGKNRSNPIR